MPYEIKHCNQGYYWISYSGTVTLELRLRALRAVEAASTNISIRGNIIDFRDIDLNCSFTEQFEFASRATEQPGHRGRKAAYLINKMQSPPTEILQLAMCNRGIETRLFTDELQAINWLTGACYQTCKDFKTAQCALGHVNSIKNISKGADPAI